MLTLLSVAYPFAAVGPGTAGGAEQVLWQLDRALVSAGHRSIVVAREDSEIHGELVPVHKISGTIDEDGRTRLQANVRELVSAACSEADLVHFHGVDFDTYVPDTAVPMLVTLHLPPHWYPQHIYEDTRLSLNCVSQWQHDACPAASDLLSPICNGVDLQALHPSPRRKRNYVIALGRICPEKGQDMAVQAARDAGVPLIVAGEVFPYEAHLTYCKDLVTRYKPKLIGSVGGSRKRRLLAGARAVLIPSTAPETSSLVAMEAAACGTAAIGLHSGALPEVIEHGRTGFIVDDVNGMAGAIARVDEVSPEQCRRTAEERFDVRTTAAAYLSLYARLACEREDLFERCPEAPPFLHPAWQRPWWELFGNGKQRVFRVRRAGELVALTTCFEYEQRLVFTGNGISDRLDILATDLDAGRELMEQLRHYQLDLQEIPRTSPLLKEFPHVECSVCPKLDLRDPVRSKLTKNLRQARRSLGDHSLEADTTAAPIEDLFRLHRAQWQARGESGVLADRSLPGFHRRAAQGLSQAGLLRCHVLRTPAGVQGVLYGFTRGDVMHYYLSGYNPELERFSPGSLLIEHAIDFARSSGQRTFDFLRGAEPYKYRWGALDHPQYRIYS